MQALYVLFSLPNEKLPQEAKILSFLSPADEKEGFETHQGKILIAAKEMATIREQARCFYIDLVARVGATPCQGESLRNFLADSPGKTPWWYHPITAKSGESEPTFDQILQIFTINHVANREGNTKLILYHCDQKVVSVLTSCFEIVAHKTELSRKLGIFRGFLARIKNFTILAQSLYKLSRFTKPLPDKKFDVIFQGFWDWSVKFSSDQEANDVYFKQLPKEFSSIGKEPGWFLWYTDDHATKKGRTSKAVLTAANTTDKLVFVQKFLTYRDLIAAFLDIRPLIRFLSFRRRAVFKTLFEENGMNYYPLFENSLPYYFCNASIPTHQLAEIAHQKAFAHYRPKIAITFQELFLWSRAWYQGARKGSPETCLPTIQHASYNREKTFVVLDPKREFEGFPDGQKVPTPDLVFVSGLLGKQIFHESGFDEKQLFITGSPRYDHIRVRHINTNLSTSKKKSVNLLLAPTLNAKLEFRMVTAAILAAEELEGLQITLRSHPHGRIEDLPEFIPYLPKVHSSTTTLADDLEKADIILFTYSTVAEEALLLGKTIWKWDSPGFNGSVFRDIPVVPCFHTVKQLRASLQSYIQNPTAYTPTSETQSYVLKQCFHQDDGLSAQRIAHILNKKMTL